MAEIYQLPENGNNNNQVPAWLPYVANNGGILGNGSGLGGGILGFLIGAMCANNGGLGGIFGGGNNNANAQMLSNAQQYLMEAINHNGERATSAIQNLSALIGQDFTQVSQAVNVIQNSLSTIAANQGTNALQIINALQLGNQNIISQFQQCCCQNQLALANLQGSMNTGMQGIRGDIAAKSAADQLALCKQTYELTQNNNDNTRAILGKLGAIEDDRKNREITALNAKVAQLEATNTTAAIVANAINPLVSQLNNIRAEVDAIKRCQPSTITLPNNSMTAVPTIWANAVADNIVDKISVALQTANTGTTTGGTTA